MGCIDYSCNENLGTQLLNICGEELLGGSSMAVLLECNHQLTNPSNGTAIAAEIAAGRAYLIKDVKIGIAKASPIEVESNVACGNAKLVTYERTGTWIDGNVNNTNVVMYDKINGGRTFGGILLYLCGTEESQNGELVEWIDAPVNFTGSKILPSGNNEFQRFESDFKWRKKTGSTLHNSPVGIFV